MLQELLRSLGAHRIGEVNLLLAVLREEPMDLVVAKQRVREMAGNVDRMPIPDAYVELGVELGMITLSPTDICLTQFGVRVKNNMEPGVRHRFSPEQTILLAPEINQCPELAVRITAATNLFRLWADGSRRFSINYKTSEDEVQGLLMLQSLGATELSEENGDEFLILNPPKSDLVLESLSELGSITEEALWARLDKQRERAREAELYVLDVEKQRLVAAGAPQLANLVERISERNVNAGYDIQSFESTGDNRYIEVKSAVANKVRFYWSVAERKKACELGASYWIYFVPRSQDLNIYPSDIVMIRDPINELGRSLEESPTEFAVNIVEGVDVSKRFDVIWKKRASL